MILNAKQYWKGDGNRNFENRKRNSGNGIAFNVSATYEVFTCKCFSMKTRAIMLKEARWNKISWLSLSILHRLKTALALHCEKRWPKEKKSLCSHGLGNKSKMPALVCYYANVAAAWKFVNEDQCVIQLVAYIEAARILRALRIGWLSQKFRRQSRYQNSNVVSASSMGIFSMPDMPWHSLPWNNARRTLWYKLTKRSWWRLQAVWSEIK